MLVFFFPLSFQDKDMLHTGIWNGHEAGLTDTQLSELLGGSGPSVSQMLMSTEEGRDEEVWGQMLMTAPQHPWALLGV